MSSPTQELRPSGRGGVWLGGSVVVTNTRGGPEVVRLYSKQEVARLLHVSTRSVDRLRSGGELKAVKVRGRVRFRHRDVAAYVERGGSR